MSFLLRECDVMDGANFFCCPRAVPLTLPELSLSPIHKLKLLFYCYKEAIQVIVLNNQCVTNSKKGAKVLFFLSADSKTNTNKCII